MSFFKVLQDVLSGKQTLDVLAKEVGTLGSEIGTMPARTLEEAKASIGRLVDAGGEVVSDVGRGVGAATDYAKEKTGSSSFLDAVGTAADAVDAVGRANMAIGDDLQKTPLNDVIDTLRDEQTSRAALTAEERGAEKQLLKQAKSARKKKLAEGKSPDSAAEPAAEMPAAEMPAAEPAAEMPAAEMPAAEPAAESEEAPKAKALLTPEKAQELFSTIHGGSFDPKSRMDKQKMAQIEELAMELGPDAFEAMSPNQFALRIYRDYDYV